MPSEFRTGIGYDVHAFAGDRELIIGGIKIPFEKGLAGHSDADVLIHAICDALLGSLALGDIGKHFPDNDPAFKNIDSSRLLSEVNSLIKSKGYMIVNVDATVIMERPKISPFIERMREKISSVLNSGIDAISIKATTTEKLGFTGREEGIAAIASVLLKRSGE